MASVAVGAVAVADAAWAQTKTFDVPAQPAATGVAAFARQADVQVLVSAADAQDRRTNAVRGAYSVTEGLRMLLAGTGLSAQSTGPQTWTVVRTPPVEAAAPLAAAEPTAVGELVVTAQKREQRLIDVPISIAAVTADDIDRRNLVGSEDYLRGIPGVNHVDQGSGTRLAIVIRGLETSPAGQNFATGPTVATYFGETPTTNSAGITGGANVDLKLVDIDRVEVLRGPQGTAFGNASLGGAVRVIPKAPRADRFEGHVAAGYSHTGGGGANHQIEGAINLPLIADKLALRAVAYRFEDSGYYRNVAAADPAFQANVVTPMGAQAFAANKDEIGSSTFSGARLSALFQATDDLRVTVSYATQKVEVDDYAVANRPGYVQAVLQVAPEHAVRGEKWGVSDADIDLFNLTAEYDLGWADLLATYSHINSGSVYARAFTGEPTNTTWALSQLGRSKHREDSGEIRLATKFDGPLNVLAGVYAEDHDDAGSFDYVWYGAPSSNLFPPSRNIGTQLDTRTLRQTAVFGELSWEILPALTLTGGARYYDYERVGRIDNSGRLFVGASLIPTTTRMESKASGTNLRANLSYKPNDASLLYASFSQGFRLGKPQAGLPAGACDLNGDGLVDGTNGVTIQSTRRLGSDEVDSYELGAKFSLLDRRLLVAADVFRMDWSGVPVSVRAPVAPHGCGQAYNANAGAARSEGVEGQLNFSITPAMRLDLGASYIDARLTKDAPALGVLRGARLPGSPKVNANLGVQYEFAVRGHPAFVRADAIYVGSFYGNLQESPPTKAGDYVKIDLSGRLTLGSVKVDAFVKNLTDEDSFVFRGTAAPALVDYGFRLRPRTVGVQVAYDF